MPAAKAPAKRAAKKQAAQADSTTVEEQNGKPVDGDAAVRAPEMVAESPKQDGPPEGMYPEGARLFSYKSKSGVTIWLPLDFPQPTAVQVWETHDKPPNFQTWQWMKWANVPRPMQRQIVELLDSSPDEYYGLFDQWMITTRGGAPKPLETLGE